ncbi:MAG: ArnT family glycosyltransferase [Phycisphaerae bacterium]
MAIWIGIVLVYLLGTGGSWWPSKDSALYLGLGRSLAAGEGYVFNGEPCNYVSPGMSWIISPFYLLTDQPVFLLNIWLSLTGLASLVLIWRTLCHWTDAKTALLVTAITAVSYRFYLSAHEILSDQTFTLLFWLVLYSWTRFGKGRWTWTPLLLVGAFAAAWVRSPGLLALSACSAGVLLDRSARPMRRVVGSGLIFLGSCASVGIQYLWAKALVQDSVGYARSLLKPDNVLMYYLQQMGLGTRNWLEVLSEGLISQEFIFSVGIPLAIFWVIGSVLQIRARRPLAAVTVFLLLLLYTLGVNADAVRSRYMIPVVPMFIWLVFLGLQWVVAAAARRKQANVRQAALRAAMVFGGICLAMNVVKVGRWVFWYTPQTYLAGYPITQRGGGHYQTFQVAQFLNQPGRPAGSIVMTHQAGRIMHYLTGRVIHVIEPRSIDDPEVRNAENPIQALRMERQTAADADRTIGHVRRYLDQSAGILIDREGASELFTRRLDEQIATLAQENGMDQVYQSPRFTLYMKETSPESGD